MPPTNPAAWITWVIPFAAKNRSVAAPSSRSRSVERGARKGRSPSERTSQRPRKPWPPVTRIISFGRMTSAAPVVVFEPHDVVLAQVRPGLHLDDLERYLARVGEPMRLAEREDRK